MKNAADNNSPKRRREFPTAVFLTVVFLVCAGLALSAGYSFITLSELRQDYLRHRGAEIAGAIDVQARGPGRRNNPSFWQSTIDESLADYADSVAFLSLTDSNGEVLAAKGEAFKALYAADSGFVSADGVELFIVKTGLIPPRQSRGGMSPLISGWSLHIGLFSASADFIRRQASIHLAITSLAIVTLLILAYYFLHVLNRFLKLQARQESGRRLAAIGTLSATLAHEIRNPLGAMKGLTQLAQEKIPPDHDAQGLMKTVVSEAERLERLVSDLLAFAKPREPEMRRVDVVELVTDIKSILQNKSTEAGVEVSVSAAAGPILIETDENGLRQVLLNVLLNALQAMPYGGEVTIAVREEVAAHRLAISIDDEGVGLGSADPEEFFQPFTTTRTQGTGLGLAVSRQIVERLGGSISLGNRSGKGACCRIILPLAGK